MYNVSTEYQNVIKMPSREFSSRVLIGTNTYTDDEVIDMSLEGYLVPGEEFTIGTTICTKFEISIMTDDLIKGTYVIEPFIGLDVNGVIEEVPLGKFNIDDVKVVKNIRQIVAYDNMIKLEKAYFSDLTYPTKLKAVVEEICFKAGVTLATTTFPDYSIGKIEGKTLREAVGIIAGICGGFARINRLGQLEIVQLTSTDVSITADNFFGDLEKSDKIFTIKKITAVKEDNSTLSAGGGLASEEITFSNNFITQSMINNILAIYKNYSYMALKMNWQGNPALDVGDIITITDIDDTVYQIPVMRLKLIYSGGLASEISSVAKSESKSEYNYKGSISKKVEVLATEQANIKVLLADKATIEDLVVSNAKITTLESKTASIEHVLAGNIGAANIAAGTIVAGSQIIAKEAIGDAQISNLSASKLTAGIIDAAIITVKNLNADNITVGTINGQRIADGAIDNSKVATNANIDGSKLNISSVVTAINEGTTTIQGSKISIEDGTLDVKLSTLINTVTSQGESISNQSSQISVLDNAINLKLDAQTYNNKMVSLDSNITTINTNLSKATNDISVLQGQIATKVSQVDIELIQESIEGQIENVSNRIFTAESSITQLSNNIALKVDTSIFDSAINDLSSRVSSAEIKITDSAIVSTVRSSTAYLNDLATKAEQTVVSGLTTRVSSVESSITQLNNSISSKVNIGDVGTLIEQNSSSVKVAIGQLSGGNNLIKNSRGNYGTENWSYSSAATLIAYNDNTSRRYCGEGSVLRLGNSSSSELFAFSSDIYLRPNTKYTLSGWRYVGIGKGIDVFIMGQKASDTGRNFSYVRKALTDETYSAGVYKYFKYTFETNSDEEKCYIRVDNNGADSGTSYVYFMLKLEEGENATPWTPHPDELKTSCFEVTENYARFKGKDGCYIEMNPSQDGLRWHQNSSDTEGSDIHYLSYVGRHKIQITTPLTLLIAGTASATITLPTKFKSKKFSVLPTINSIIVQDASTNSSIGIDGWYGYLDNQDITSPLFTYRYQIFPRNMNVSNVKLTLEIGYIVIA